MDLRESFATAATVAQSKIVIDAYTRARLSRFTEPGWN